MTLSQRERRDREREENRKRDHAIIEAYIESEVSMMDLVEQFGISRNTIRRVLHEAQDMGLVKIRKQGVTLRKKGENK